MGGPRDGGTEGAPVTRVTPGSTADEGGLEAGDVIAQVDDQRITDADSLVATIRSYRPGDSVEVTRVRDDETQSAEFVLDSDGE
ncbi:PDZ domain-containing protein [Nocardioides sp. B-3]|uniref:PDZ domain-containing protein n=1 Tax=Nocardioides sp. B-3 TaxID=2895565 RepID=UPI0021523338|nr:PDZ domain-containing protein [Nocardioides sp. B-3]UUZ57896.1 PDZ domain-containing protein [Nocardioides sp. B-3]